MNSFEFNKIFAAVLVAGITASFAGFVASKLVHIEEIAAHGSEELAEGPAAGPQLPEPVLGLIATADPGRGATVFKACAACHNPNKGGADGVGPHLWNVLNRGHAAVAGFAYSEGMKSHAGAKWTYDELNHFLWKPKSYAADTKMNFIGVKKPEDRAAVIAYLRTMGDSQPALPSAGEIQAEADKLAVTMETETDGTAPTGGADAKASTGTGLQKDAAPATGQTPPPATPTQDKVDPESVEQQNEEGFKPGEKGPVAP